MEASAQLSYGSLCCIVPRERYENTTTTVSTASLQSMSASFYGRWRVSFGLPRIHPRPGGSRNSRKSKARWSKLQKTRTLTRWGNSWRKSSWVAKRARRTDPRVKPCGCFPAWPYSQPLSLFSWHSRGPATVDRCLPACVVMYLFPSYLPRDDDTRGCVRLIVASSFLPVVLWHCSTSWHCSNSKISTLKYQRNHCRFIPFTSKNHKLMQLTLIRQRHFTIKMQ